jgi:hypothetical protein
MTDVLPAQLSPERARALTNEVRRDAARLWLRVLELHDGGAHFALGYTSWGAYWEAEFDQYKGRGDQLVRAGKVARALELANAPLPANELQARELFPVLYHAPTDLVDVWSRVLEGTAGKPTARYVREVVAPYLPERRPRQRHSTERVGSPRRARNRVAMPVRNAHAAASTAAESVDDALATEPTDDMMRDWLEHAEKAHDLLGAVVRRLRRELQAEPTNDDGKGG